MNVENSSEEEKLNQRDGAPQHLKCDNARVMGRRNKNSNSAPFVGDPQKKHIEMSPSTNFKILLYALFDVSPAGAFLENTVNVPAPTTSKKQSNNPQQKQLQLVPDHHSEASGSESSPHEVKKQNSVLGSSQRSGGGLLKLFKSKSSKSADSHKMNRTSNLSSSDADSYYNGDVSSESLFDIQDERGSSTYSAYHNGEAKTEDEFREIPHKSEFELLARRVEKQEWELQKLKDELSSLRSSSGSSQVESPRSRSSTSGSETFERFAFDRAVSPSESSRTSITTDAFDGDSHFFDFYRSDEGQLVELVQEEQTRPIIYKPPASDGDMRFANVEEDVPSVRRSSRSRSYGPKFSDCDVSSANAEKDVASVRQSSAYNGRLQQELTRENLGTGSESPEGPGRMIVANQCTKDENPSVEVVPNIGEGNCSNYDTCPLEHAQASTKEHEASKETGSFPFVSTNSSSMSDDHEIVQHALDERSWKPAEENHVIGVCSEERLKPGKLQELGDSERISQEIEAHLRKISIVELRVHDRVTPELAENDQGLNRLREAGEKFRKLLHSRRDNSYSTMSSSLGPSAPSSVGSTSARGSESSLVKVDVPENSSFDGGCDRYIESLSPNVESGMPASRAMKNCINDQIQDIHLPTPRGILVPRFDSLVRNRSLHLTRHGENDDEEVDTNPSVVGRVPTLSRELSFSVLTGYKQLRDRKSRGEMSHAVATDSHFRITGDKTAGMKLEEHADVPLACEPTGSQSDPSNGNNARRLGWTSSGCRLTRFGEEAAKLAMEGFQPVSPHKLNCPGYNRILSCLPSEPVSMNE